MSAGRVVLGWFVAPLALVGIFGVALSACSDGDEAAVYCEDFAERRVGADLEFWQVGEYEVIGQSPEWTVHHAFTEPDGSGQTEFVCTVTDEGDQWRLVDMTTSRLTGDGEWTETVRAAGFDIRRPLSDY